MKKNKNILKYAEFEARKNKTLAVGSRGLKGIKFAYCFVAAYTIMMCLVVMFGNIFAMMEYADKSTQNKVLAYNEQRMYLITLCISITIMIATYVLLKLKLVIPFAAATSATCIVIFSVFLKPSIKNDIKNGGQMGFWGPFGIPAILCVVISLIIMAIYLIDKRRVDEQYNLITTKLYNKIANDEGAVDYDAFEEVLDSYCGEEIFDETKPLKKSQKVRKQKQDNTME